MGARSAARCVPLVWGHLSPVSKQKKEETDVCSFLPARSAGTKEPLSFTKKTSVPAHRVLEVLELQQSPAKHIQERIFQLCV